LSLRPSEPNVRVMLEPFTRLREEFSFVRGNFLVLLVTWILARVGLLVTIPFHPFFLRGLGATPVLIGMISALGVLAAFVSIVLGASATDVYGRKQLIVRMTYFAALTQLLYVLAEDWQLALVASVLHNLALIYIPALQAMEADSIPPGKRSLGFAVGLVVPSIPALFSPLIGGHLIRLYGVVPGMRIGYAFSTLLLFIAALIRTLYLTETLESPRRLKARELLTSFGGSLHSISEAIKASPTNVRTLILSSVIMNSIVTARFAPLGAHPFVVLYARDVVGISEGEWGLVMTAFLLLQLAIAIPLGKLVEVFGEKRSMTFGCLLSVLWFTAVIASRELLHIVAAYVVFAVATPLASSAQFSLLADTIPRGRRGRLMGTTIAFGILLSAPLLAVSGYLYQLNPATPFMLSIALLLASLLMLTLYAKEPEEREE